MKNKLVGKINRITVFSVMLVGFAMQALAIPQIAGCKPEDFIQGSENNEIRMEGKAYTPKCLKIKVGGNVSIQASEKHPLSAMPDVDAKKNPFAGGNFTSSQVRKMNEAGIYGYFCDVHGDNEGDGMAGAILVEQ